MDGVYSQESQLEPIGLIRASRAVVRTGTLLLTAGTGSYRVKTAMKAVGRALGMTDVHAQVTINEITATCHRGPMYRTEVAQTATIGVNSDRIQSILNFCNSLTPANDSTTVEDIAERLNQIETFLDRAEAKPHLYPEWLNALCAAIACGAFAFLNNGGLVEIGAVIVGAFCGQFARRLLLHRGINQLAVAMIAGAIASVVYLSLAQAMFTAGLVTSIHESGYISAVLFLVPGFPLITAALDLSHLDFSAGMSRLAYALMIMISAALAVWAVSTLWGLVPVPQERHQLVPWALFVLRLVASALGVWGFAMIFNSPVRVAVIAALVGMIANTARLVLVDSGVFVQGAAFFAGLLVGILCNILSPRLNIPRITLSVPAVVIMIPGAAGYRAIYYLNAGDTLQALTYGVEAVFIVIAVAVGLTFARTLTDRNWLVSGK